jgi:hypothetical protein
VLETGAEQLIAEPMRIKLRSERLEPKFIVSATDRLLAKRPKLPTLAVAPPLKPPSTEVEPNTREKDRTETELANELMFKIEQREPNALLGTPVPLALTDKDDPRRTNLRTDRELPMLAKFKPLTALPTRANERRLTELPHCRKVITDSAGKHFTLFASESPDPRRRNERQESELPKFRKSKAEQADPSLPKDRSEKLDPRVICSNTEQVDFSITFVFWA